MSGNTLRLGRLFNIEVKLDYSWFIISDFYTKAGFIHYAHERDRCVSDDPPSGAQGRLFRSHLLPFNQNRSGV